MRILGTVASSSREVPGAPTIGTATNVGSGRAYNNGRADITFTAPAVDGGFPILDYTVTSSPGGFTTTGASSPLTVTGLQSGVAYTFTVTARTAIGTGPASAASNSITATTIPQTPTITSATRSSNTVVSIAFTGATGGAALSAVTATSSPSVSITSSGTSSPMTATATYASGQAYTFTITATNANGTSAASNTSSSVTPFPVPTLGAWSAGTTWPLNMAQSSVGSGNGSSWWAGGGYTSSPASINNGYYWNGSGFTSSVYPVVVVWPGAGVATNSSSNSMYTTGGYDFGGANTYSISYTWDQAGGFVNRVNYPFAAYNVGLATLGVGPGPMRGVGGSGASNQTSYYISTLGGNWTSSGVNTPWGANMKAAGTHNAFGGEGWYFAENVTPYKVTSTTSGFTAMTNTPWTASTSPRAATAVLGSTVIIVSNNTSYPNPYSFNGSTYTAQTAWPVSGLADGLAGGASASNVIRLVRSANGTTHHYTSTLS